VRTRLALLLPFLVILGCEDSPAPLGPPSTSTDLPAHAEPLPVPDLLIAPSESDFVTVLADGVSPDDFAAQHGLTLIESDGQYALFTGSIGLEDLEELPGVEDASTNQEVHLSESLDLTFGFFEGDWVDGEVNDQDAFEILQLPRAHDVATGAGVTVAVLDTGADLNHVHLEPALVALDPDAELRSEETQNGIDEDGDGMIDEAFGHGTHVAGIVRTVAPDAHILPIKVLSDDGIGSLWDFLKGLKLASEYGVQVINLSMSLSPPSALVEEQLARLSMDGIITVSAAGNDGWRNPVYPAVSGYVLGVAALESNGALSTFTGAGSKISLAAPGVAVLSSYPRNRQIYGTGTSMATPIVTATVALALQADVTDHDAAIVATCLTAAPLDPVAAAIWGRVVPPDAALGAPEGESLPSR
jgi:subtilisin family serine protease